MVGRTWYFFFFFCFFLSFFFFILTFFFLKNKAEQTPLHYAAKYCENEKIVDFLLEKGANIEAIDERVCFLIFFFFSLLVFLFYFFF